VSTREMTTYESELAEAIATLTKKVSPQSRRDFLLAEEIHERNVRLFASQLEPVVKEALLAEGAADVAGDWINDAKQVLVWLRLPDGSEIESDDLVSQMVEEELAAALQAEVPAPSLDEIETHATELAQLLLSNWSAVLEHGLEDAEAEMLDLDFSALPSSTHAEAVLLGCEAFAPSPIASARALQSFQEGQVTQGKTFSLSPTLHLVRRGDGRCLVARVEPEAAASAVAQQVSGPSDERKPNPSALVFDVLRPWLLGRTQEFFTSSQLSGALTMKHEEELAVETAKRAIQLLSSQDVATIKRGKAGGLAADVAVVALRDLTQVASGQSRACPKESMLRLIQMGAEVPTSSIYRITMGAIAIVFAIMNQRDEKFTKSLATQLASRSQMKGGDISSQFVVLNQRHAGIIPGNANRSERKLQGKGANIYSQFAALKQRHIRIAAANANLSERSTQGKGGRTSSKSMVLGPRNASRLDGRLVDMSVDATVIAMGSRGIFQLATNFREKSGFRESQFSALM
jgi:hypothetical protein